MEESKRLHAEQRRKAELFDLKVESEVLRIRKATETISRSACMKAAKQFYINNGYTNFVSLSMFNVLTGTSGRGRTLLIVQL